MSKKAPAAEAAAPTAEGEAPETKPELSEIEAAAAAQVAAMAPAAAPKGITEQEIRAKMKESGAHGLSRKQAIAVLQAQREEDARTAAEKKAKG